MATATVTYDFVNDTIIESGEVDQNFTDILTFLNASVVHVDGSKAMTGLLTLHTSGVAFTTTTVTDVLDEDTMVSNSATKLATQQSIKAYADLMLPLAGGTMTGILVLDNLGVTFPTSGITIDNVLDEDAMGSDSATALATQQSIKAYADLMLPLAGGTMSGAIAMGTNKITGMGDGSAAQDAATVANITGHNRHEKFGEPPGDCEVTTSGTRIYNNTGKTLTIVRIDMSCSTAPTGSGSLTGDVHKDGSTIYTTGPGTNRPIIALTAFTSTLGVPEVTSWADGSYLEFMLDVVGGTLTGADLVWEIFYTEPL